MKRIITALLALLPMASFAQDNMQADSVFTSIVLDEVKVTVPSRIRMKDGNMITRVVGSSVASVGNAEDVLAHIPGLMHMQGEIQVVGKGTPIYYINGRRVQDLTELKRLSSHDIKDVEVITNPGSQYDAQVNAVVRIRTIRQKGEGLGVSLNAKNEFAPSCPNNTFHTDLNLNYRHNALDVFGGATFNDNYLGHYDTNLTQQVFGAVNHTQTGTTHMDQQYDNLNYNLGFNYQPNDSTSFGAKVERTNNLKGVTNYSMEEDILRNNQMTDHLYSDTRTDAKGLNAWLANAYLNGKFGKMNVDWNADYYTTSLANTAKTYELSNADQQGNSDIKWVTSDSDARNRLFATKLVLSYPLGNGKIEAGTELTFAKRENRYDITEESINNDLSSVNENNYALFASFGQMIPKAGMLNMGLRYEHVDFKYENELHSSQNLSRNTNNIFPFISFATQIGELQGSASFTTKTRRPNYRLLRTNIEYNNRFSLSTGDPTLKNEIDHQADLSLRWRWLSGSATFSSQKNGIYDWTYPYEDNGTVLISWVNFDKPVNRLMFYVNASPTFGIWQPSYTVGYQKQWLNFDLSDPRTESGTRRVSYNKPMYIFLANNTFRVPMHNSSPLNVELNSEFLSSAHFGNAELTNCFWNLTFAVQKSFLKNDALSVRLSCGDIFHTAYHNVNIDLGNYMLHQSHILGQERNIYDFQRVSLSVHYRFNTTKSKYRGTGAGQEAKGRM